MECYSIIDNDGIIITCNNEFISCTGLSDGDNIFSATMTPSIINVDIPVTDVADTIFSTVSNDNDNDYHVDFITYINGIDIANQLDIRYDSNHYYQMITVDGWKYQVYITHDTSLRGIRINIPYQQKSIRLGDKKDHLILQSDLCLNHNVQHIKILVVDDSVITCKIVKKLIESTGSTCDTMTDSRKFVGFSKDLLTSYYNIILIDINMPHINGYELCKVLRPFLPKRVHVIATSTDISESTISRCTSVGFNDFLKKPFTISDIVDMLYFFKASTSSSF